MTTPRTERTAHLDGIDRAILAHLADHGRSSLADLAEAVSTSASSAQRRLRRLETEGVINAPDVAGAREQLRIKGLLAQSLKEMSDGNIGSKNISIGATSSGTAGTPSATHSMGV